MRHYRRVVETAARYHTTINAHEPIKDTGIRRTYPNMMTREGARDMEWNAWSQALCGEPGQFIVTARRAGEKYFLGAATGDEPCTVTIPLDFLKAGQKYRAIIYADAPETDLATNPGAYRIEEREVTAEDKLEIVMAAGGGQAVTFLPL